MSRFNGTYSAVKSTNPIINRYHKYPLGLPHSGPTSGHNTCLPSQLTRVLAQMLGQNWKYLPGHRLISTVLTSRVRWDGDSGQRYCYIQINGN